MEGLVGLSKPGIYRLEFNEYAYFGYSLDILVTVSKVISELRQGIFKIKAMEGKSLNLVVLDELEGGSDIETLKLRCQYAACQWEEAGGVVWNPSVKTLLQYRVGYRIVSNKGKSKVVVYLRTSSRSEKVVGIFSGIREAEEFIAEYYSPEKNVLMYPIFACNSLTSEQHCKRIRGKI